MDKQLSSQTAEMLEALIRGTTPASCAQDRAAAREWKKMTAVWEALDDWQAPPLPPTLRDRVLSQATTDARRRSRIIPLRRVWLAAACALVLLGGALVAYMSGVFSSAQTPGYVVYHQQNAVQTLASGEILKAKGDLRLVCPDASVLELQDDTEVKLVSTIKQGGQVFRLLRGTVRVRVCDPLAGGDRFRVLLPDGGMIEDLSTEFTVTVASDAIDLAVLDGRVRMVYANNEQILSSSDAPVTVARTGASVAVETVQVEASEEDAVQEGDALSAQMRARLAALKAKAARTKGEDWVEAIGEMVDITDNLSAQSEVLSYLTERIRTQKSPVVEVDEVNRALHHDPCPELPEDLVQVVIEKAVTGDSRLRGACVSVLQTIGDEARSTLETLIAEDGSDEYQRLLDEL